MNLLRSLLWILLGITRQPQSTCNGKSPHGTRCIREAGHSWKCIDARAQQWRGKGRGR
jgi:hypothetical protein